MILRDVTVAEEPRVIARPALPERAVARELLAELEFRDSHAPLDIPASVEPVRDVSQEVRPTHEPILSFEAVAAWLAVQDNDTRIACASMLAEEITQVHETARTKGFAAGEAEGREQARKDVEAKLSLLKQAAAAADAAFVEERVRLADSCVDVVSEAFTKLAGHLLASREAAQGSVSEVLSRVTEGRELTVRVNSADLPTLQQVEAELAAAVGTRKISLLADPRVELGGCIVDSKLGSLDGRLEVQLRGLYDTLRAAKVASLERA